MFRITGLLRKLIPSKPTRSIFIAIGALAIFLVGFKFLHQIYLNHQVIVNLRRSADQFGQTLRASIEHLMVTNQPHNVQDLITQIAVSDGIDAIRVIDRSSVIRGSSRPEEIGLTAEIKEGTCQSCHNNPAGTRSKMVTFTTPSGTKVFRSVNPIQNRPVCHGCHDPDVALNGVIITDFTIPDRGGSFLSRAGAVILNSAALSCPQWSIKVLRIQMEEQPYMECVRERSSVSEQYHRQQNCIYIATTRQAYQFTHH